MNLNFDCLIVGGGPAGLTAATYLGRFRRRVLLMDSGESRASWIPVSHNILGFSQGVSGPDLLQSLRTQADQYGARRLVGRIEAIKKQADGSFLATWENGQVSAAAVLVATGGLDVEPDIADAKNAVRDGLIRHCPICDAYEATGKRIALIAYGRCRIKEALLLRGYTSDLTVLTLGNAAEITTSDRRLLEDAGIKVILQPIQHLTRENGSVAAWTGEGPPLLYDTMYSALGMRLRSELAIALGAQVDENGALIVDAHQQTTVSSVYAAGDIVHGLSQVSVAAGQAAIAATAINAGLSPLRF